MYQFRDPLPAQALILAGGKANRLGGVDKGLIEFHGRPLISTTIHCLGRQIGQISISANRSLDQYQQFGLEVIRDELPDYPGPLAGICAAMKRCDEPYLLVVPCDTPFIPDDLAIRLYYGLARSGADIALAHDGKQAHYLHAMLSIRLLPDLEAELAAGKLSVQRWYQNHRVLEVDFSDKPNGFINVNTADDLAKAESI